MMAAPSSSSPTLHAVSTAVGLGGLKSQFVTSDDHLVTLALNSGNPAHLGVPLVHHGGVNATAAANGLYGPDNEFIHGTGFSEQDWQIVADSGAHISIAPAIEMQMGHGIPPFQAALDHGMRSLSSDLETNMTADMFTLMRAAFCLQRMLLHTRAREGETNFPPLFTCYQVIQMATVSGTVCAHLEHKVGTLTPGKEADIIMLDGRALNCVPINNVPGTVMTMMDPSNVVNVFVAGKLVKHNGNLVGVDVEKLKREVELSSERVLERIMSVPIPVDGLNSAPGYTPSKFGSCCVGDDYDVRP